MAIYEMRTYTLYVGKLGEAIELYKTLGWPALQKYEKYLVGYFTGDVGSLNEIVHLWKFEDEADRRKFWAAVYADQDFMAFATKFRPLLMSQQNKFLLGAPWGPNP
jgi:hypothetical protein